MAFRTLKMQLGSFTAAGLLITQVIACLHVAWHHCESTDTVWDGSKPSKLKEACLSAEHSCGSNDRSQHHAYNDVPARGRVLQGSAARMPLVGPAGQSGSACWGA